MNDMSDRLEKLACMKRLHDALSEAIAALESGRDADVEYRYPEHAWHRYPWLDSVEHRCTIKPRELWVNTSGGKLGEYVHASREEALADSRPNSEPIRFVEAPDDEP